MSIFKPNQNKKANTNNPTVKNTVDNKVLFKDITEFFNNTTADTTRIYKKLPLDTGINQNNYRRNLRVNQDTAAIRSFKYNYYTGKFLEGFPASANNNLCPQKISTVAQYGSYHFSSSRINPGLSSPNKALIVNVTTSPKPPTIDCNKFDFSGTYILYCCSEGLQLTHSSNPYVNFGNMEYIYNEDYFDIFLYPNESLNIPTYVHIRFRIPIKYRYSYGDWTFWESFVIRSGDFDPEYNTGSNINILDSTETEFIRIINCNQSNAIAYRN